MRLKIAKRLGYGGLWLACLWLAWLAPSVAAAAAEGTRSYRVEMIFFTLDSPPSEAERPPRDLPPPDMASAVDVFTGRPEAGFRALPPSAFQLNDVVRRLRASGRYTVIGHVAWIQPGLGVRHAVPVALRLSTQDLHLHGTIKVVLARYLHVYVNLLLETAPRGPASGQAAAGNREVHVVAHRRTRSKVLNYLDHPSLGIVFEIWPVGAG